MIDVILVSTVLYLMLPDSIGLAYLPFLGAYLASIVAGVMSHVPAGLGVLESMLLLLLPDVPPEQLLASVLMYRVIYEIVPVTFALGLWAFFEGFTREGALLRLFGRQARVARAASPTIDSND
jgi:phosphatidylglycerol lysyltransferase